MTAGAMRVTVSFRLAWPNALGDLDLRAPVPVPVGDGLVSGDAAGQRLVAGVPGADRGEDEAAGAGQGQVAVADGEPGAASLLRGGCGEGGVAGDAPGHLGGDGSGRDFLRDQLRGYTNGRHRTTAMLDSSVRRTVVIRWK